MLSTFWDGCSGHFSLCDKARESLGHLQPMVAQGRLAASVLSGCPFWANLPYSLTSLSYATPPPGLSLLMSQGFVCYFAGFVFLVLGLPVRYYAIIYGWMLTNQPNSIYNCWYCTWCIVFGVFYLVHFM